MSQHFQAKFEQMCQQGKFSTGLVQFQNSLTKLKNAEIQYSIYEIICSRCQNIIFKILQDTQEVDKITRSDLEDFNEKTLRIFNIAEALREREKPQKILEPREDYDLVKQIQWNLDVLDRNFKLNTKDQNYKQSLEVMEQQCQRIKRLDEFQSKLLQLLAFFNKDQNKMTKNVEVYENEVQVLTKLAQIYKNSPQKIITFYSQRKQGIIYELKEKYIEEIQSTQEQNYNYQMIFKNLVQQKQNIMVDQEVNRQQANFQNQNVQKNKVTQQINMKNYQNLIQKQGIQQIEHSSYIIKYKAIKKSKISKNKIRDMIINNKVVKIGQYIENNQKYSIFKTKFMKKIQLNFNKLIKCKRKFWKYRIKFKTYRIYNKIIIYYKKVQIQNLQRLIQNLVKPKKKLKKIKMLMHLRFKKYNIYNSKNSKFKSILINKFCNFNSKKMQCSKIS